MIGLIAVTGVDLVRSALVNLPALMIFVASLVLLYRWHAKIAALVVVLGAGSWGCFFRWCLDKPWWYDLHSSREKECP